MRISTHAPLAGRNQQLTHPGNHLGISTHAPLAGRNVFRFQAIRQICYFNPRAPCGAQQTPIPVLQGCLYFNPRAPCGAQRIKIYHQTHLHYFNPRAPCGAQPNRVLKPSNSSNISTHAPLAGRNSKSVQITMHIFAITDKFQMLLHRMPPVRAFCSFLMQENHADFGCEPPK